MTSAALLSADFRRVDDLPDVAQPWAAFRADVGFVGRAVSLVAAIRLIGALTPSDGVPRRLRNTVTGETLEWTKGAGWLTTQKARGQNVRPMAPLLDSADPDSPRYRKDIHG